MKLIIISIFWQQSSHYQEEIKKFSHLQNYQAVTNSCQHDSYFYNS